MKVVVTGMVVAMVFASRSEAEPVSRTYNAFDLTGDLVLLRLEPSSKVDGALLFQGGSVLPCSAVVRNDMLVVAHDKACPLFTQSAPAKFTAIPTRSAAVNCGAADKGTPDCVENLTFEVSNGTDVRGHFDGTTLAFSDDWKIASPVDLCVASLGDNGWKSHDVPSVVVASRIETQSGLPSLPTHGLVMARAGKCDAPAHGLPMLRVTYGIGQATTPAFPKICNKYCKSYDDPCTSDDKCKQETLEPYPNANVTWVLYVDQANDSGTPRITYNPNNYVRSNSFGRVRVRHWKNVTPLLATSGTGAALTMPSESGGVTIEKATPTVGPSLWATDGDALISEFVVVPRAPGALNLAIKFNDVADHTKSKGEVGAEILVDKAYSGAFRFGLSRVFDLEDVEYVAVKNAGSDDSYTISKNTEVPHEVVLGISFYSQWIAQQGGRTYFLRPTYPRWYTAPFKWLYHHAGLYVGIGALSYAPNNLDFLKSVHLGVELEIVPNLSVALTAVIRRTPVLGDGVYVGDEVPTSSVNTSDEYRIGYGVVLNFSTDFLKFAAKGGQ